MIDELTFEFEHGGAMHTAEIKPPTWGFQQILMSATPEAREAGVFQLPEDADTTKIFLRKIDGEPAHLAEWGLQAIAGTHAIPFCLSKLGLQLEVKDSGSDTGTD